jgi:hypothetical protein
MQVEPCHFTGLDPANFLGLVIVGEHWEWLCRLRQYRGVRPAAVVVGKYAALPH